jgi:hypothetical protein
MVACRLLPFRANLLGNIIAGAILTLVKGFLTPVPPLVGARTPALPEYVFFAMIEIVGTSITTVDCGLSTSTRWISSVIANFGCIPVSYL